MTKLKCDVFNCVFQQEEYCTRSHIKVIGERAKNVDETSCGSFHREERVDRNNIYTTEFAEFGTINRSLSVNCESINCMYNRNELCIAEKIKIGNKRAKRDLDTKCETFKEKES